jgi:hypothetical protein
MSSSGYITAVNCFAKSESKSSQLYKLYSARGNGFPVWYILQKGTMGFSTGLPAKNGIKSLGRLFWSSGTYREVLHNLRS